MIAVIDYGAGNLQSVVKALKYIDCDCIVTNNKNEILNADGALLPGVGSFGDSMDSMNKTGTSDAVIEFVKTGKPFLGICLARGLGLLNGSITKIPSDNGLLKIPHMGWNSLEIKKKDGLYRGIDGNPYVYFVHSYFLKADDENIVSARTYYGTAIDASVQFENIYATQFHPEKSGKVGLQILNNFVDITKR